MPKKSEQNGEYSLLTDSEVDSGPRFLTATASDNHDYDEPYFEPACTEEDILLQLKSLGVPIIPKESLKCIIIYTCMHA